MHKWQKGDMRWQGWWLWLELGRSESFGLVMLETVFGVMFGDVGFSHEDCDGFLLQCVAAGVWRQGADGEHEGECEFATAELCSRELFSHFCV